MNTPLVSVIIPVYNAVPYIRECMDSVLTQTLRDIEIICVDDGSTDRSFVILKEYETKDSRVRVFPQNNSGTGSARNVAIKNAIGEYIAFMDSDDYYPEEDILEVLYTKAMQNNVSICGGSLSKYENNKVKTKFPGSLSKSTFENEGIISYHDYQYDYYFSRFIYKRIFLLENNLFFPDYLNMEDPPFFVKAMLRADIFYAVPKITYCFRINYKKIDWDYKKVNDRVKGIIDILILTIEYKLPILHKVTVDRLNDYTWLYHKFITPENMELLFLLLKANALVDIEMLKETNHPLKLYNGSFKLDILQNIRYKKRYLPATIRRGISLYKQYGFIHTTKKIICKILKGKIEF